MSSIRQPSGVQGTSPSSPTASRPALTTWKPSTSLAGSIASITAFSSICVGQRQLDEDAVDRVVGVEPLDEREQLGLAGRRRASWCSKLAMPASTRRLALVADIDLARRILADQHHGEAGLAAGRGDEGGHGGGDARAQALGEGLAVDDAAAVMPGLKRDVARHAR